MKNKRRTPEELMELPRVVAVYGTLKQGFYNNSVMGNARFLKEDVVTVSKLDGVGFPRIKLGDEHKLRVELFVVETEADMNNIDSLEGFHPEDTTPYFYDRKQVMTSSGELVDIYEIVDDITDSIEHQCVEVEVNGETCWDWYRD